MTNSVPQILSALAFSMVCTVPTVFPQGASSPTVSATGVPKAVPQASAAPANPKGRVRRTAQGSKPQPVAQPSPVATESPLPLPATAPASADTKATVAEVPAPEAEPEGEPKLDTESEAKPQPAKIEEEPTPEERSRVQLKAVALMVAAGRKQEAIAELHLLSAEDRFDPQGFYNIANALARLDATDAAISTYRKAIEQRKGHYSRAWNNLGVVLLRQGFWDQASEAFLSALRVENFHYAEASYNLGRLYAARGEMDRAIREWRRAVAVDSSHTAAARALSGAGNFNGSASGQPIARNSPVSRSATREASGIVPTRNRNPSPARTEPFTLDAETHSFLQRGRTGHERGRYEEAIVNFRRVISRMGGYFAPANLELSYSLMALQRTDEAIAALLPVTVKDGARFPISYYYLGRLYELRGDLKQAENNYALANQAYQGENSQALLNLVGVREKRGDFSGALSAMEEYVRRIEQQGQKPAWSDARLATLRQKVAAQTPPKQ